SIRARPGKGYACYSASGCAWRKLLTSSLLRNLSTEGSELAGALSKCDPDSRSIDNDEDSGCGERRRAFDACRRDSGERPVELDEGPRTEVGEMLRRRARRPQRLQGRAWHDVRGHLEGQLPGRCLQGRQGRHLYENQDADRPRLSDADQLSPCNLPPEWASGPSISKRLSPLRRTVFGLKSMPKITWSRAVPASPCWRR